MTIERSSPTGTARYIPPQAIPLGDAFNARSSPSIMPVLPLNTPQPMIQILDTKNPDIKRIRLTFHDNSWGENKTRGYFDECHTRLRSSTLDARYPGQLTLPVLTTTQSSPVPDHNALAPWGFHVNGPDGLAIAMRSDGVTDPVLFIETSTTNPALIDTTYSPPSLISGIWSLILGGITSSRYVVGHISNAATVLTDITALPPTEALDMHTDTAGALGMIQVPLPNAPILIWTSAGVMMTLSATVAATTQPTTVLTGLPDLGYGLGVIGLEGRPPLAYWMAYVNDFGFDLTSEGGVYFTALSGLNWQKLDLPIIDVQKADFIRGGIIAMSTDGRQIVWHNGTRRRWLRPFEDRPADSDKQFVIADWWVIAKEQLILEVHEIVATGGTGNTRSARFMYEWDRNSWQQVTAWETLGTATARSIAYGYSLGGLPFSPQTRFMHRYSPGSDAWARSYAAQPGESLYALRKSSGASAGTGIAYGTSGVATSPTMTIRELEGWLFCLRRIIGPPQENIDACGTGGTPGSIAIAVADREGNFTDAWTATFTAGSILTGRRPWKNFDEPQGVYELTWRLTMTQQSGGTDPTRFSGNGLPFTLEFDARAPSALSAIEFGDEEQ